MGGASREKGRVLLAMSGGVDSSTAAKVLLDEGYEVCGITMVLLDEECSASAGLHRHLGGAAHEVTSAEARMAKDVCDMLGIDHITLDLRDSFYQQVIQPFCVTYLEGRTPNPCVLCNKHLKFGILHKERRRRGFDYLATGHYAKRVFDETSGLWNLCRAADHAKDQSYFLYNVTQDELAHTLFPLSESTKHAVRKLAFDAALPSAQGKESQDICFIADGDHVAFIESLMSAGGIACVNEEGAASPGQDDAVQGVIQGDVVQDDAVRKDTVREDAVRKDTEVCLDHAVLYAFSAQAFEAGDICDRAGTILGRHTGLINYTLGQRKGIGVAAREPLYVVDKDVEQNRLVVGFADEALIGGFIVSDFNAPSKVPVEGAIYTIKAHYRQTPVEAKVSYIGTDTLEVKLLKAGKITSPGQSLVVYEEETVIGGGVISSLIPKEYSQACSTE